MVVKNKAPQCRISYNKLIKEIVTLDDDIIEVSLKIWYKNELPQEFILKTKEVVNNERIQRASR